MKRIISLLLCSALFAGCNPGKIFERYEDIDNNKWSHDKVVTFSVNIEDTGTPYDVGLAIRHSSYYAYANIKVNVTVVFPSGEERTLNHDLLLRNTDGTFKAEGAGDLWDITFPVYSGINFTEKGTYTFKVLNIMPQAVTEDIMQIGLIVTKVK
jgi:gliding motility-associated lipoprotein GldH